MAGYKGYHRLGAGGFAQDGKEIRGFHGHDGRGGPRQGQAVEARPGRAGRTVMVCSGDAGIYAMAGLLLEVLENEGLLGDTVPFEVVPGVASVQRAPRPCSARRSCTTSPPSP